ncbi:MAG: HAD-IA family hydrolase [Planctomycetota bacterium]
MTAPAELLDRYAQFDALVFDLDGTLADTMPAHYASWSVVAGRHGLSFPEATFYSWGGRPSLGIVQDLAEQQGVALDHAAVAMEKEAHYLEHGAGQSQPIEPVLAIARAFRGRKPLAIGTGGRRRQAEPILAALAITDWFDAIVTADDVTEHKPHPATYLLAAERIAVAPERCVVFEDTDLGLDAGRAAGMTAVDIRGLI